MAQVINQEQLEELLASIDMFGTRFQDWSFDWKLSQAPEGYFIQSSFERFDVDGGTPGDFGGPVVERGYGRKWYIEYGSSQESVVFTAWLAIKQIIEHELHESFTVNVNGEQVRLLDPHKSLEDLAVGSRRL